MVDYPVEILTNEQMTHADKLAVEMGIASLTLMENAGRAVADEAIKMADHGARIVVLCGPGNNGGDGFVAARYLRERGYDVAVYLYGDVERLKGDAAEMARRWLEMGAVEPLGKAQDEIERAGLIIDAIFGAGLARAIDGEAGDLIAACNHTRICDLLAVDVPSGLSGTTGQPLGEHVFWADRTVTFFRLKPGHVLYPGRQLCGRVVLADIGIPDAVLSEQRASGSFPFDPVKHDIALNDYRQACSTLRDSNPENHKYDFGHALVLSGPANATGAARLAARAALRVGAGLVTMLSQADALPENAAQLTAIMLRRCEAPEDFARFLADERNNVVLIGPGFGVGENTRRMVLMALVAKHAGVVLDADALTSFADDRHRQELFTAIHARHDHGALGQSTGQVVMTPHEGEFRRLFPNVSGCKYERARDAAEMSGAEIVLKGADTVIAGPKRESPNLRINTNAPPWLATAGSGDVLAGLITGLLAQGVPAFEAACAGVWIHGKCANRFGPGLIAEDLPEMVPAVLRELYVLKEALANQEREARRKNRSGGHA
ncbi:MAG: NAD(P)H-hydrate dehydratase [Filomicrobium sp.]